MNEHWQTFLDRSGATIDGDGNVRFPGHGPDNEPCPDAFITALPRFTLVGIDGAEAADFLQGQLTCDIEQLPDGGGTIAAWCNPKGRVITTLLIFRLEEGFIMLLPAVLRERVLKRLRMFILRSDVQFTEISDSGIILGCRNCHYENIPADNINRGADGYRAGWNDETIALRLPDGSAERVLIVDTRDALPGSWEKLTSTQLAADSRCWDLLDMEAGIPWLDEQTSEQFLPQELNLDETGGLSFTKGCYPGQEVIARLRHRGQVKRRLYHATAEPGASATAGMKLKDDNGKTAGMIIACVPAAGSGLRILAVLDTGKTETGSFHLENGSELHVCSNTTARANV